MEYMTLYNQWCSSPLVDADTKTELAAISSDPAEIEERFYRELEFGTAGLRGILGAGTNRMNVYVVRRASLGLAAYLLQTPGAKEKGVCIAYDSRIRSDEFARETAVTLAAGGIKVYLFSTLHAVPQLSFTLQRLSCMAGVVITASHNPSQYNGYKVYWAHGGQVGPAQAQAVFDAIQTVPMLNGSQGDFDRLVAEGRITMLGQQEDDAYYDATAKLALQPELFRRLGSTLKLIYTPLHGTGNVPVRTLLHRMGVTNVTVVPAQAEPDGTFPTVKAPNPEDPDAFRLSISLAEEQGATVCIATDPDADRMGIAVKTGTGDWVTLTGNQIGCILIEHMLSSLSRAGKLPQNGVVIKSIVSTRLADAICAHYGVELANVLTGFRFISEKIDEYARTGEKTFLFGFEESFGFLAGGLSRDKDGICAAMLAAEACLVCMEQGITLYDMLQSIYARYGFYNEKVKSYTLEGKAGMEKIAACMDRLRTAPPTLVDGVAVTVFEDYLTKPDKSNMVRFLLENGAWVVVRPSGTEPKLKLYIGANAATPQILADTLSGLFADMDSRICNGF